MSSRQKENSPSLLKSPKRTRATSQSPGTPKKMRPLLPETPPKKASPLKASVVARSFYSKQKPLYLTPLERKQLQEAKSPPLKPSKDQSNLPASAADPDKHKKPKMKVSVGGQKSNLKSYFSTKPNPTDPPSSIKTVEVKKPAPITFSSLKFKNKPKIVVGAAFFGTGKKPTSMYKKHSQKPRPTQPAGSQKPTSEPKTEEKVVPAPNNPSPVRQAVFITSKPNTQVSSKVDPDVPQLLSPFGINKELRVALRRSVSPINPCSSKSTVQVSFSYSAR